jgi:hypothetical protein
MAIMRFRLWMIVIASLAIAGPAYAQSPPPAASAAPATSTAAAPAEAPTPAQAPAADKPAGPSAAILKKAREVGMRPEQNKKGATVFCWEDADIGTRFKTKKCTDEIGLEAAIEQRQTMLDQMRRGLTSGPASK